MPSAYACFLTGITASFLGSFYLIGIEWEGTHTGFIIERSIYLIFVGLTELDLWPENEATFILPPASTICSRTGNFQDQLLPEHFLSEANSRIRHIKYILPTICSFQSWKGCWTQPQLRLDPAVQPPQSNNTTRRFFQ
jgi:hypothetical protein